MPRVLEPVPSVLYSGAVMTAALVQLAEAASAFGVSRDTVRRRLDAGAIPEARWGLNGWEFPTEALSAIAEREGWPLDLTGRRPSTDDLPEQLDRYISETVAAHAAVVLAKTQAAAARAEAQDLGVRLQRASKELLDEQQAHRDTNERFEQARADGRRVSSERKVALARLDEVRLELAYERSRSAHLHKELNQLYGRHAELVARLGPLARWRYRRLDQFAENQLGGRTVGDPPGPGPG